MPVRTRVGHSFIKAEMARTDAVFGGEHSAHYYFRDFWGADTGMLAAMHVLAALGEQDAAAVGAGRASTSGTSPPARSTRRWPTQAAKLAEVRGRVPGRRRSTSWTGSPLQLRRRRLVQPAPVQHRAAAAAQRRGADAGADGRPSATRCSPSFAVRIACAGQHAPRTASGRSRAVALDPQLLEILACPDTHHAPLTTTPRRRR